MRTAIALSAALLTSVAALPSQKGNSVAKRQGQGYDFNEITWQGIACKVESRDVEIRGEGDSPEPKLVTVTNVEGDDPPYGVLNFLDYCGESTAPLSPVKTQLTVENDCYDDKTFTVDVTDSSGATTTSEFTLNVGGSEWNRVFADLTRPSKVVVTSGTDVITFEYDEYEASDWSLHSSVWWCDPN